MDGKHHLHAQIGDSLVLPDVKRDVKRDVTPDAPMFCLVAIHDPRYSQPLLLASNLAVSAHALWRLYRDRCGDCTGTAGPSNRCRFRPSRCWERSIRSSSEPRAAIACESRYRLREPLSPARAAPACESRYRLPELALLAGNILSYVAATSAPVASGFWDRASRPTCGRVRRSLLRVNYEKLPVLQGQLRKKNSVTSHLKTGVEAHRRHKPEPGPSLAALTHAFTGN